MKYILEEIKYRTRDFLIFSGAFFVGVYEAAKETNDWFLAILFWIFGAIPFVVSAFIVSYFTKKSLTGKFKEIDKKNTVKLY